MTMFSVFIGSEKTADGDLLNPEVIAFALIQAKHSAASQFGGYSVSTVSGGWVNSDGKLIEEQSYRFDVMAEADRTTDILRWAEQSRVNFQQGSVLVVAHDVVSTFVEALPKAA